jgi:hypothetical protein
MTKYLPQIGTTNELHAWFREQIRRRSTTNELPRGMPEECVRIAKHVARNGNGAFIRFSLADALAESVEGMPIVVKIDYVEERTIIGMSEAHTMRMLATEFMTMAPSWRILPLPCIGRDYQGRVIHQTPARWTPSEDPQTTMRS